MKHTQIRHGCFETNSSSMHSIAIRKKHEKVTEDEEKKIWLHDGMQSIYSDELSFERYPFRILFSMMDKAKYVIASRLGGYHKRHTNDEEAEKFLNEELYPIIRKYRPDFKGFRFNTDYEDAFIDPAHPEEGYLRYDPDVEYVGIAKSPSGYALRQEDGSLVPLEQSDKYCIECVDYGNIDHQSVGLLDGFLKQAGVSLEDFLTDSAYIVVVDGDEYMDFERYMDAGIIRSEDFEKVYSASRYGWSDEVAEAVNLDDVPCDP